MFAIGFLSLLSIGFVAMAAGGDDDVTDMDQADQGQDDYEITHGNPNAPGSATDDLPPPIDDPVDAGETDPGHPVENVTGDLDQESDAETPAEEDETAAETEVVRPPMGEEYRDPLVLAEQRAIAAMEAREPVNLVTVTDAGDNETDDTLVMTENANSETTGEPAFTVEPTDGPNAIAVNFDYEHTFQINYSEDTTAVIASLNSDIQGPEGEIVSDTVVETDSAGAQRTSITENKEFSGSTDIILNIDFDQIGVHFSKIDLSNPADTLHFEFNGEIPGNLHMITEESEDRADGDNSSSKTVYIIHTPSNLTAISQSAIDAFKETDNGQIQDGIIVAEIYLGEDSVVLNEGSVEEGAYELLITNFVNDNPNITSNIDWTSEGEPTNDAGYVVPDDEDGSENDAFASPFSFGSFFGG
ncbi:hypothetical protein OS190_04595 [Sulfitobacter sp. F26204]|uniref:hypothetical protein n=1 Tax=Sulfitobacter sp. F26204 TaxID=2996014 RepID=UPI00225E45A2|nr:hypothetical protein [Sulfitobacter sp. F26204]MCX7558835.1 hypothetical protein [Sulfitobacter sp. F26204]